MKRLRLILGSLGVISMASIVILAVLLVSKNHDVSKYKAQVSALQAQSSFHQKQSQELSVKLNEANSTISQLSTSGSFIDGTTCKTQQLAFSEENDKQHNPGGAAGTIGQLFSYQNISKSTCTVQGYPGFLALDGKGYVVPDGPIQTGPNYNNVHLFNDPGSKVITLPPNQKAYFVVSWSDVIPAPNQVCISPSLLESTPPGALSPLVLMANGSGNVCGHGISISSLGILNDF